MKQLHEYDTPETEAHPSRWQHGISAEFIHADFARDLEQRLAACRDALAMINNTSPTIRQAQRICDKVLTLTAPK
jgi:hypothetical protein